MIFLENRLPLFKIMHHPAKPANWPAEFVEGMMVDAMTKSSDAISDEYLSPCTNGAFGTKRTFQDVRSMSAFRDKGEIESGL